MAAIRLCTRCGLRVRIDGCTICHSCNDESMFVAGVSALTEMRPCPVCGATMRREPQPHMLRCPKAECGATFDVKTAHLDAPGTDPVRLEGRTLIGRNAVVRNDARKRLQQMSRTILDTVQESGQIPSGTSSERLLILASIFHEGLAARPKVPKPAPSHHIA